MVQQGAVQPLPFSLEAEEAVIGSILVDPACIDKVVGKLQPNDFYTDGCGIVYTAMIAMKDAGQEINPVSVGTKLQSGGSITLIPYLHHAISVVPTSLDVEYYADEVKRFSFYRSLVNVSSNIAQIAMKQQANIAQALDQCDDMVEELRTKLAPSSRRLILGEPRLIQTNPPRYIWNVNNKDLRLTLGEITNWGRFKNRVIAELNFVPEKPKFWDDTINSLITHSYHIEAPIDASEEQQLKITILGWFERKKEATVKSDLKMGFHVIREVTCKDNNFTPTTYYFFQSTPLIDYLKKEQKRNIISEDLWVFCAKWGGIKYKLRPRLSDSNDPITLWGLPIDFAEEKQAIPKITEVAPPEDF